MKNRWKIRSIFFVVNAILYLFITMIAHKASEKSYSLEATSFTADVVFYWIPFCVIFIIIDVSLSLIIERPVVSCIISSVLSPVVWYIALLMRFN